MFLTHIVLFKFLSGATEAATSTPTHTMVGRECHLHQWLMIADGTGVPASVPTAAERSVQMSGTFNGTNARLEGSNDKVTWFPLAAASFTPCLKSVSLNAVWIRPITDSGGEDVSVNVSLLSRNKTK